METMPENKSRLVQVSFNTQIFSCHNYLILHIRFSEMNTSFKIYPLGDAAAGIELGSLIDESINKKAIAIREWLDQNAFEGLRDIIVAYSSVSVYYDPILVKRNNPSKKTAFDFVAQRLETAFHQSASGGGHSGNSFKIPVCYSDEFGIDIEYLSREKNISREEIIHLHTSKTYRVYMIGFLPGFSYLGKINEKLVIARKPKPITISAGSIGIAGSQTGIYPLVCPGGWQIIGRTPLKFFEANALMPTLLNIGDYVQFYEISKDEYDEHSANNQSKIED
jgi:inhibitor of KinA